MNRSPLAAHRSPTTPLAAHRSPLALLGRGGCRRIYGLLAGTVILLALLLTLARLALFLIGSDDAFFQRVLAHDLGRPVSFGKLRGEWMGWYPRLYVEDMEVLSEEGKALSLEKAYVEIDVWGSLMALKPKLRRIVVVGPEVRLQLAQGEITLGGVSLTSGRGGQGWLSRPIAIGIEKGKLLWCEESSPCLTLRQVNLGLESDGRRLRMAGHMEAFEGRLRFFLRGRVDELEAFFLEGKGVHPSLASPFLKAFLPSLPVKAKRLDFALWGIHGEKGWRRWTGRVSAFGIAIEGAPVCRAGDGKGRSIARLSAAFDGYKTPKGWAFSLERLKLPGWPSITINALKEEDTLWVNADFLRLEDLWAFIPHALLPRGLPACAMPGTADSPWPRRGDVYDLRLRFPFKDPGALALKARFSGVSLDIPGKGTVKGLKGAIQRDAKGGRLSLANQGVEVSFPHWFRLPLEAEALSADIAWRREGEVEVTSLKWRDRGFLAKAKGRLQWKEGSPLVSLLFSVEEGDVTRLPFYLPARVMPKGTVKWLDRAFDAGRLRQGRGLFYGRIGDFPFKKAQGVLDVRLQVEGVTLDYHKDWPTLRELSGEVRFKNQRMVIQGDGGKVFSSTIRQARIAIPDLLERPARLEVEGEVEGPLGDGLRFLRRSPLRKRFARYLRGARAQGSSALRLNLTLPLGKHAPFKPQVKGTVALQGNRMTFIPQDILLSRLRGTLTFTEKGLRGRGIQGSLWGQPVRLSLSTQGDEVMVQGRGSMTPERLGRHYPLPFLEHMRGRTDWEGKLRFRGDEVFLDIASSLQGLAIDLPEPLGKAPSEVSSLTFHAHLTGQEALYRIGYRQDVSGALAWRQGLFTHGELRFGGAEASLPEEPGLHLTGAIPRLALGEWLPYLMEAPGKGKGHVGVDHLRLTFGHLSVLGQTFRDVKIQGSKTVQGWWVKVEGAEVKGRLHLNLQKEPWLALALQELHLAGGGKAGQTLDPNVLVPLRVTCERLFYRGIELGKLVFGTSRGREGWRLEGFRLSAPHLAMEGEGTWHFLGAEKTAFKGTLESDALGAWLMKLGLIRGGFQAEKAEIAFDMHFPGSPSEVSLKGLEGELSLHIQRAQLKQLDPGLAKVFGLLSLKAIPRRLALDFRDLFEEGLICQEMRGRFIFQDGYAYTSGFILEGPTARIEIKGRTGLITRDIEQEVIVIPHLGASLPLAGALAGGIGPGAVALLAQRLLKKPLEHLIRYRYRVTGSWENPKVAYHDASD